MANSKEMRFILAQPSMPDITLKAQRSWTLGELQKHAGIPTRRCIWMCKGRPRSIQHQFIRLIDLIQFWEDLCFSIYEAALLVWLFVYVEGVEYCQPRHG